MDLALAFGLGGWVDGWEKDQANIFHHDNGERAIGSRWERGGDWEDE